MSDTVVHLNRPPSSAPSSAAEDVLSVLSAVSQPETQVALTAGFDDVEGVRAEFARSGLVPLAALKSLEKAPDAFFFEARDYEQAANWLEALRAGPGGYNKHLVVLIPSPTKTATVKLLQMGADDVLSTRPDSIEIARTLARASAKLREYGGASLDGVDDLDTRLVAVIHAAGGQGATTLAVNTAVQLQRRVKDGRGGACLIDFDLQFGDAHLQLDLTHHSRLPDVMGTPDRLDRRMLDDLMINAQDGLKVLTAPEMPVPLDALPPESVDKILSLARRRYRYVVVDMPAALTRWTETVLHKADHILLVTEVNVPSLRAARRLLDTIRSEEATHAPITVVANRYSANASHNRLTIPQAAKALDREISVVLPNDYQLVIESLDQGIPASVLKPSARLTTGIAAMLDTIAGATGEKKKRGLMASLPVLGRK